MKRRWENENGVALVLVLLLSAVALTSIAGLLYMLGSVGFVSGQQKRYHTALEAGRGGVEATLQVIADRGTSSVPLTNLFLGPNIGTKLSNATSTWGVGVDSTSTINPADNTTYDMRFDLGTYRIYSKIVDTVTGNSSVDEGLVNTGVVVDASGQVTVANIPYLYTAEELVQGQNNVSERSKLSVLYQY